MADQSSTKTIAEWEREHGIMFKDARKYPGNKKLTDEEFRELYSTNPDDWTGVNHEDREKWLKANGYELTRANMMDATLSTKQAD